MKLLLAALPVVIIAFAAPAQADSNDRRFERSAQIRHLIQRR
ncbi:MAG TPA: hypothetical protein VG327_06035 [Mycobacterium sp.]|nr:hypothetical protein [Mycobacterium sp.]